LRVSAAAQVMADMLTTDRGARMNEHALAWALGALVGIVTVIATAFATRVQLRKAMGSVQRGGTVSLSGAYVGLE
jgi:hypothetical protein